MWRVRASSSASSSRSTAADGGARAGRVARVRAGVGEPGRGGADQERVAERAARRPAPAGQLAAPATSKREERAARSARTGPSTSSDSGPPSAASGGGEPLVGGLVAAEEVLGRRAARDQPHAQCRRLVADERQRFDSRARAALRGRRSSAAPARGRSGCRSRAPESSSGMQAQRGLEPARRRRGRARRCRGRGLEQQRRSRRGRPATADCSTWRARATAAAPRAASADAARPCAPIRQPPPADS